MSKPLSISLQNLNSLYFKFLSQFVLQYLPKSLHNQVSNLLNLKSAVQAYRFLDKILNSNSRINVSQKRYQSYAEKSNISEQGSTSYLEKDDLKYQKQLTTAKNPPLQLKRNNTYAPQEQKSANLNHQSYNLGDARVQSLAKKYSQASSKSPVQKLSATNINFVKKDLDTVSQRHLGFTNITQPKKQTKITQQNGLANKKEFQSKGKRQSVSPHKNINNEKHSSLTKENRQKNRNDQNTYTGSLNNYKRPQFDKPYSIQQSQTKILAPPNLNTSPFQSIHKYPTQSVNRTLLKNLIKQTRQIFAQNSKKIARYERLSSEIGTQKTQKNSKPLNNPGVLNHVSQRNFYKKY